jgi:hypothetical protein
MRFKMILVAALALVLASCSGGGASSKTPAKAAGVKSSYKVFEALNKLSILSVGKPRLQDGSANCSGGGTISFTTTGSQTSASITITAASGCTEDGTTIRTGTSGFTLSFSGSATQTSATFTIGFNGSLTVTTPDEPQFTYTFSNFQLTINVNSSGSTVTGSITVQGSITTDDGVQSFSGETWSFSELGVDAPDTTD